MAESSDTAEILGNVQRDGCIPALEGPFFAGLATKETPPSRGRRGRMAESFGTRRTLVRRAFARLGAGRPPARPFPGDPERSEDQPEDLYVALLSTPRRSAVVAGMAMVFGELAPALAMLPEALAPAQQRALDALMTLIDLAHPAEFKRRTESVLTLVLDPAVPEAVRDPVVRAAVGYARGEDDVRH